MPGIKAFVQNVPAIRIGGQLTKSLYQYTLQATDTTELYQWAPKVEEKLRALPGLVDVTSDLQITKPQVTVAIDRNQRLGARRLGAGRSRTRSTTPTARARCRRSTRRPTSTGW